MMQARGGVVSCVPNRMIRRAHCPRERAMPPDPATHWAQQVLAEHYPAEFATARLIPQSAGGFSGASVWRVEVGEAAFAWKQWPPGLMDPERLARVHAMMRTLAAGGITAIPPLVATRHGGSFVEVRQSLGELAGWRPGRVLAAEEYGPTQVEAACRLLAQVHMASLAIPGAVLAVSPNLRRRQARLAGLLGAGFDRLGRAISSSAGQDDSVAAALGQIVPLAARCAPRAYQATVAWQDVRVPCQMCLRDVWAGNLLFEGPAVSGLIDLAAAGVDCVATDLARLLGSTAGDDPTLWHEGLAAYEQIRPLRPEEHRLVGVLDQTAVVLGAVQWVEWLAIEGRSFPDSREVARRLDWCLRRLEVLALKQK